MRRAAKVDANQEAIVSALRAVGASVQSLAAVGKGVPDLLVWHPRVGLVLVEVKDQRQPPNKRKLKPLQERWHKEWRGPVAVVCSVPEALRAVGVTA